MDAHAVRSEGDTTLFAELQEHPIVRDVLKQLEKREGSLGTRRSLLATALRLTPAISPDIHAILTHCRATLQVDTEIELFVYASPSYNAACARPEGGRVFVLLASSLMEAFDREELLFVIGHELGHHVYDHHRIPVGMLTHPKAKVPASLILRLHAWQRYAEISADRAGLLCTGELSGAARALFKLSSGLSSAPNEARIQAFLDQATDLYQEA